MSWTGPDPSETPNPLYGPGSSGQKRSGSSLKDAKWFILGLIVVGLLTCAFVFWLATSSSEPADSTTGMLERNVHLGFLLTT